jgi:hypothetical protein
MQGARLLLLAPLALSLLAGCYETPRPACAFGCSQDGDCPDGYSCRADSWCKRDDVVDELACAPPVPDAGSAASDAAPTDAGPVDAALPDGAVDAMPASPSASMIGT